MIIGTRKKSAKPAASVEKLTDFERAQRSKRLKRCPEIVLTKGLNEM